MARWHLRPFLWGLVVGLVIMGGVHLFVRYRMVVWPVAIKRVTANPRAYEGRMVMVTGRVGRSFGLMSYGAYSLNDGTATITVLTDAGVPEPGRAVRARGMVMSLRIDRFDQVVIFEKRL